MRKFEGKVVLVTGASSGLGEAAALKFAQEGASVVVADLREEKGRLVVAKIEELGAKGTSFKPTSPNELMLKPWLMVRSPDSAGWTVPSTMQASPVA